VLDLSVGTRDVGGVIVLPDAGDPQVFYALPPPPAVGRRDGAPDLQLLRFVDHGQLTGGHLQFSTELAFPPDVLDASAAALGAEHHHDPVNLARIPVISASAELLFAGREERPDATSPLIRRTYGTTIARLDPPHVARFALSLTPEGVQAVEAALRSGGAPVGVIYRLQVEGLWPAMRIVAHVDWGRIYDHFSSHVREGALFVGADISTLVESLIEARAITIDAVVSVVPDPGQPAPDPSPVLAWIQRELVERFCEPVMPLSRTPAYASLGTAGEIFNVGSAYAVKKITQIERAVADLDFQHVMVVSRTLAVQAHLADLLGGAPADAHISDAPLDHPFFQRFVLHVQTARPLADSHVKEVALPFSYGTAQDAMRLTAAAPDGQVDAWADASPAHTWEIRPEVTIADDAPIDSGKVVLLPSLSGQSRELTLDLDRMLGTSWLDVRSTPDPRVQLIDVTVTQHRGDDIVAEPNFGLSKDKPADRAWFRDVRPLDRFTVTVEYLLADGRTLETKAMPADTRVFVVPPVYAGAQTIRLISDDDWTGLSRVLVSVQKGTGPAGMFEFDKPGMTAAVNLDLPDPADRTFRYRVSRILSSGQTQDDDWIETDQSVVIVGLVAANQLVVDITPVGVEPPAAGVALIEVDMSYIDADHQFRQNDTFPIRALADHFRWTVALKDPLMRSYKYRVTTHRTTGATSIGPWTTTTDRLIVVPVAAS
jgi:hypothetical protein